MRWHARIIYRTDSGPVDIEHHLDEIGDIHEIVEAGPHWDTVIVVTIRRINHVDGKNLTVEQARRL